MGSDKPLLRDSAQITSLDELATAKKRAELNATQDRLRLENNLGEIRDNGPKVLLRNVVLPVAAVAVGTYAVAKVVGSLTADDGREYYDEPVYDYDYEQRPEVSSRHEHQAPRVVVAPQKKSGFAKKALAALPVLIKSARMAVSYLENNGTNVPPILNKLFAGPKPTPQRADADTTNTSNTV